MVIESYFLSGLKASLEFHFRSDLSTQIKSADDDFGINSTQQTHE